MMCTLQRVDADHIMTWGDLLIRNMSYVTLEPSLAFRKGMVQRIPAGQYVLAVEDGELVVKDVEGGDIRLVDGPNLASGSRNIHVGYGRGKGRWIEGSCDALIDIRKTIADALADGDECFLCVVDGHATD